MGDPFRVYEAGRKAMYAGMESHDEDPAKARADYTQALKHFEVRILCDCRAPWLPVLVAHHQGWLAGVLRHLGQESWDVPRAGKQLAFPAHTEN